MLISMTLTLMQGHSGSADEQKSALSYLDNKAGLNSVSRDLDFENIYIWHLVKVFVC